MILSDALQAERPSLWAVQPCLTRKRGKGLCAGVRACACRACVRVCLSGGETLFLDVTAQPSLPLLSNTSLLFRGFHRRPVIRKTRSPACRPAGAGRGLQTGSLIFSINQGVPGLKKVEGPWSKVKIEGKLKETKLALPLFK